MVGALMADVTEGRVESGAVPSGARYFIEAMQVRHIPAVAAIERESFPVPWPVSAYRREIERNQMAYYIVAKVSSFVRVPRANRRFAISDTDSHENESGLLSRLARLLHFEDRTFTADEAGELETPLGH